MLIGIFYDSLNVLALTFFFLAFSAVELGIGLILLLFQNAVSRTVGLNERGENFLKMFNRARARLYKNKIN